MVKVKENNKAEELNTDNQCGIRYMTVEMQVKVCFSSNGFLLYGCRGPAVDSRCRCTLGGKDKVESRVGSPSHLGANTSGEKKRGRETDRQTHGVRKGAGRERERLFGGS